MSTLQVVQIGNELGVILPPELLTRLKVQMGDHVFVSISPDGVLLTAADAEFEAQLRAGREFMVEHRDVLRALAK